MTTGISESARERLAAEEAAREDVKRQKTDPKPVSEATEPVRIDTLVKEVLTQVGAMDADGDGLTIDGLTDVQRVQLALKLQQAIDLIKEMPVVDAPAEQAAAA
jgi:hypothetical protein